MKLRAPAVPLITVDPYFSVWSTADRLTDKPTTHWTDRSSPYARTDYPVEGHRPNSMLGLVTIDGTTYRFMGVADYPVIKQTDLDITALSTTYTFETETVAVTASFLAPVLPTDFELISRPVNYLKLSYASLDGKKHTVSFSVSVSEEICLNLAGQSPVVREAVDFEIPCIRMGNVEQNILNRDGDDLRIDWGYFYLAVKGANASVKATEVEYTRAAKPRTEPAKATLASVTAEVEGEALILFAYDDIKSLIYFGDQLTSYWNKDGETITTAMSKALASYDRLVKKCKEFSDKLYLDAIKAGGEKYADILALAYRQVFAAHKLAVDTEGELIWVSKECFSNGCAVTVDVSYPSIPIFLHYNPELVKAMMRPIFKYAASDEWEYDFAPHDAGRYPIVNGQVYGKDKETGKQIYEKQMPVEECGNMLIMAATTAIAQGNTTYVRDHMETLEAWTQYLIKYGQDPEHQLCTDDFAGHLAHNCNLSLKAVMGIASLSILFRMMGNKKKANEYMKKAEDMADIWTVTADNGDGSYKLAFDREGTFSMKYNAVWDKLFGTQLFAPEVIRSEVLSNFSHFGPYGMPLDNRSLYTKSDWLVWTATMTANDDEFRAYIEPLWKAYHYSPTRVPLTDWYDTHTGLMIGFQHRTVQGGLFIKLMEKDFMAKCKKILKK